MKKIILITGASSGFGKHTVEECLKRGHTVIAGLRGGHERLKECYQQEIPSNLIPLNLHLDSPSMIDQALDGLNGKIDVLVNNAGFGVMGKVETLKTEELRRQFEVNFFSATYLIEKLLPRLKESKGTIINVSSILGLTTLPYTAAYSSSKHALDAYTEALHIEAKSYGVKVALVEPGRFVTSFNKNTVLTHNSQFLSPLLKRKSLSGNPLRVARLIANLCESESPSLHNVIGTDAWFLLGITRFLPSFLKLHLTHAMSKVAGSAEHSGI